MRGPLFRSAFSPFPFAAGAAAGPTDGFAFSCSCGCCLMLTCSNFILRLNVRVAEHSGAVNPMAPSPRSARVWRGPSSASGSRREKWNSPTWAHQLLTACRTATLEGVCTVASAADPEFQGRRAHPHALYLLGARGRPLAQNEKVGIAPRGGEAESRLKGSPRPRAHRGGLMIRTHPALQLRVSLIG